MNKFLIAILIIFCSANLINAQKIQLGFRVECNGVEHSGYLGEKVFSGLYPSGLQIHMALFPIEEAALEVRGGIELATSFYAGSEYGFFARYYFVKNIYGVGGIMVHKIFEEEHTGNGIYEKTLRMPAIGLGTNFYGDAYFELMYLHSGTQVVGYDFENAIIYNPQTVKLDKLYWAVKLGFGFSWDVVSWSY